MIGTAAAILGAAIIGGGASLAAGHSTANAAKDTAAENNATTRDIYNQNKATLAPFVGTGAAANSTEANFAGIGGETATQVPSGTATVNGRPVPISSSPPANPSSGMPWINNSSGQPVLQVYDESSARWATPNESQQSQYLGGQSLQNVLASAQTAPGQSGGGSPGLQTFLANSDLTGVTKQAADAAGSSYGDYLDKSGLAPVDQASDQFLGIGSGGYDAYQNNTGVKPVNDSIEKFLGLGNGGGLNDFLASTGYNLDMASGSNAIARQKAVSGVLKSGSAAKALETFGQQTGQKYGQQYLSDLGTYAGQREGEGLNYNNLLSSAAGRKQSQYGGYQAGVYNLAGLKTGQAQNYLGEVGGIANRGLSAANALAGVGTTMVGQTTANNNNALQAVAGANASTANTINSTVGNALGAYAYTQKPPVSPSSAWTGANSLNDSAMLAQNGWS